MPSTRFHIEKPCRENWEAMSPTERGRHCAACSKEVIDFTCYSEQEMMDYFSSRKGEQVCGRMELKTDFPQFTIRPKNEYKPYGYWMTLSLATMLLASCGEGNKDILIQSPFIQSPVVRIDTTFLKGEYVELEDETIEEKIPIPSKEDQQEISVLLNDSMELPIAHVILGGIGGSSYHISPSYCQFPIYREFENIDEGNAWLDKQIQAQSYYPRREQELGVSGRVIVQFTLTKDGFIQDPLIIESPENAPGLEYEAIRLTKLITGLEPHTDIYQNPVNTILAIPYLFELK